MNTSTSRRVLFVSSAGGHLAQLLELEPWYRHHERQWVTFDLPDSRSRLQGEHMTAANYPTTRNLGNLLRNMRLALQVIRQYRPDVIISNGAGVALPFFVLAKAYGIATVYIEVYDRIDSTTLTGRLCKPLASLFCLQWPEQQRLYKGGAVVGPIY